MYTYLLSWNRFYFMCCRNILNFIAHRFVGLLCLKYSKHTWEMHTLPNGTFWILNITGRTRQRVGFVCEGLIQYMPKVFTEYRYKQCVHRRKVKVFTKYRNKQCVHMRKVKVFTKYRYKQCVHRRKVHERGDADCGRGGECRTMAIVPD